jgi:acetoin utilization deacetylase AcuC-like enzyme
MASVAEGLSVNLAGGTHHAFPDSGQGYCVFNDVAVAARALQRDGLARRVLFVDLDVHQGNGTAAVTRADESLFSFSMHCGMNFPFRKEASDLDVSLPAKTGDSEYLEVLVKSLREVDRCFPADFVFYLAGADPYAGDRLGMLALSKSGLARRDRIVLDYCCQRGLPCAVSMSGGYAPDIDDIVDIHFETVMTACEFWRTWTTTGKKRSVH